jgi:hypothetical protein
MNHNNGRRVRIIIMIGFKLNEEEKDQLVLSRIGKNERIREKALKKFENFERIKERKTESRIKFY